MTGVRVVRLAPEDGAHVRAFVRMAYPLYATLPLWVPPLDRDVARSLRPSDATGAAFAAVGSGGRVTGRIAVYEPRRWNEHNHAARAFFHLFECADDEEAARALFDATRDWARSRGLTVLEGPRGPGLMDGLGLLVDGYEHPPAFGAPYNPAYYESLFRAAGLRPLESWRSGYVDRSTFVDHAVHRVAARVRAQGGYQIAPVRSRRDLRKWVPRLLEVYNAAVAEVQAWVTMTPDEADVLASQLVWLADPSLVKVLLHRDEPVGLLIAYPDVSDGQRAARGRLWPTGWAHLARARLTTRVANINGVGLVPAHRGTGALAVLASEMVRSLEASRYRLADVVQVGADNQAVQRVMRRVGIRWTKLHQTFETPV